MIHRHISGVLSVILSNANPDPQHDSEFRCGSGEARNNDDIIQGLGAGKFFSGSGSSSPVLIKFKTRFFWITKNCLLIYLHLCHLCILPSQVTAYETAVHHYIFILPSSVTAYETAVPQPTSTIFWSFRLGKAAGLYN